MVNITIDGVPLHIRRYDRDTDYAFVFDAWLKNNRNHSKTSPSLYYDAQKEVIDYLLEHEDTWMLCSASDSTTLHGFVCSHSDEYLHYVYIPFKLRKSGLARELISYSFGGRYPERIVCTHAGFGSSNRFLTNEHLLMERRT